MLAAATSLSWATCVLQVLMQLADRRNAQPLPELKKTFGLRLPPEEDCLLGANYQLAHGPAASAPESMDIDGRSAL